jgi:hypothetical protein
MQVVLRHTPREAEAEARGIERKAWQVLCKSSVAAIIRDTAITAVAVAGAS